MRRVSEDMNDPHRYDDMLEMPNHRSGVHRPLSTEQRAAQFLPFSALSGYEEGIEESRRTTEDRRLLSETQREELDRKAAYISSHPGISVTVTWFEDDMFKAGGQYRTKTGNVRRIDQMTGRLEFTDRSFIWLSSIDEIEIKGVPSSE